MTAQTESHTLQAVALPPKAAPGAIGRPSTYTPATAELLCVRLADGETLTEICRTPGMPTRQCVQQWRMRMPAFDALYYRARLIGMESMSDDTLTIADDDTLDMLGDGTPNPTAVNRARLMVHARHFLMGKLARHVYGDRVEVEHSGSIDHTVTLSDRERMRRLLLFSLEDGDAVLIQQEAETVERLPALPAACPVTDEDEPAALNDPRASDDI